MKLLLSIDLSCCASLSGAVSPWESKPIKLFYFGASVPVCAVIMSYKGLQSYSL